MTEEDFPEAYQFHERSWESYEELQESFEWRIPDRFNMAEYACDRWAEDRRRVAMFAEGVDGSRETHTFWDLSVESNRLANYLRSRGIERGDRVGVNLPTTPETLVSHLAVWKLGAVSMPLSTTFGPEGLGYRLRDCEATACIAHAETIDDVRAIEGAGLEPLLVVDADTVRDDETDFDTALQGMSRDFDTEPTATEDPAFILYTSGTTGDPKGVLHDHGLFLGNLPQFLTTTCNLELHDDDVFWMSVEWSWIAIFAAILPALFYGHPVLGHRSEQFDPERAFELVERYELTNCVFPPTALRMMQQVDSPTDRYDTDSVRLVMTAGESIGGDLTEWIVHTFGAPAVHEAYGQTEAHYVIGDCSALLPTKPGRMGVPEPGHEVTLLDPESAEPIESVGTIGEIALRYEGDPVYFTEYWENFEKTQAVRTNGWHLTGDLAKRDGDGYFEFVSRKDDVIISSGYRIGPEEIEQALEAHADVETAGVVGVPDEERGEVPKAYVVLSTAEASGNVVTELQTKVKDELARHEYPREIEVIDEIPQTQTGKTRRVALRERD